MIVGHSERRTEHDESDAVVQAKALQALRPETARVEAEGGEELAAAGSRRRVGVGRWQHHRTA